MIIGPAHASCVHAALSGGTNVQECPHVLAVHWRPPVLNLATAHCAVTLTLHPTYFRGAHR